MRKWLKPEILLLVSSILLALAVTSALFARHIVYMDQMHIMAPLTHVEMSVMSRLQTMFSDLATLLFDNELFFTTEKLLLALVLLLIPYCIFFIRSIDSDFNFSKLRSIHGAVHWLLSVSAVGICIATLISIHSTRNMYITIGTSYPPVLYSIIPGFALIWLVVGWRSKPSAKLRVRLSDAVKGSIVGLSAILFAFSSKAAEGVINEVTYVYHGQPYEYNPYLLISFGIAQFLGVLLLTIGVAYIAMAMSFREFTLKARLRWAGFAAALCVAMLLFLGIIYFDNRTELHELRKPLAISAGLSLDEQEEWEMVSLKDKKVKTVKWPLEFKYRNDLKPDYSAYDDLGLRSDEDGYEVYPATRENLERLSNYENRSNAGFMRMNIADASIGGYTALLDVRKAREAVVRNAENIIIHRIVAKVIFSRMPTTEEDKALLREFTEGIDWHEDKKGAYWLCKMYKHMDMAADGEKWCALAREGSKDELDVEYVPVDGIIQGVISFNGRPLSRGKIVLMWPPGDLDEISFKDSWMLRKIISVSDPDLTGEFKFTGLKDLSVVDGYELAVVFDHPLEYEVVGIDNPPGIINITSAEKDYDLGVINIRARKQ